jgi:hypothetical protein
VRLHLSTRQTPLCVHFANRTMSAGSPQADRSKIAVGVRRNASVIGSEREQKDHTSCNGNPLVDGLITRCNGNPLVDGRLTVRLMRRVDWTC